MARSLEELRRDLDKMRQERIDKGFHGEEYERHMANEPRPPLPLAFRCYYELEPLYEFMVAYADRCNKAGEAIPFDLTMLDEYKRYLKVISSIRHFTKDANGNRDRDADVLTSDYLRLAGGTALLEDLVNRERSFLGVLGTMVSLISFKYEQFPRYVNKRRVYNGKHFEALVDRYCERIDEHRAEMKRIAEENVKRRMNDGGS